MFKKAKWIWLDKTTESNEFAYFETTFQNGEGPLRLLISAETDYIAYLNGKRVAFGQFAGWPDEKYVDEIYLSDMAVRGENTLRLVVRYEGLNSFTHIVDHPGVIFEVLQQDCPLAWSGESVRCGLDGKYIQHQDREITMQLGLTVGMTNCGDDVPFSCKRVDLPHAFEKRPVKKTELSCLVRAVPVDNKYRLYDLGRETAGYISICIRAPKTCEIKVAYGEHIVDGKVRYQIGRRDFSFDFICAAGNNTFEQFFVRVAGRYLEVFAPDDVEIEWIGIYPVLYPLTEKRHDFVGLDKEIYETAVRTLRLCMNQHYEDCPWREQSLYVLDSRNQMLCGYAAFEETEFARASLCLMAKGVREDGLLELTFPSKYGMDIPFFTLMYPVLIWEYLQHTKDVSILSQVMKTACGIMEVFKKNIDGSLNLIPNFSEPQCWNFYEWSPGSDGRKKQTTDETHQKQYDLILNCAYVYVSSYFEKICEMCNKAWDSRADEVRKAIHKTFWDEKKGLYYASTADTKLYTQLGNAFALLIDLGDKKTAEKIIHDESLVPVTLSMKIYLYDALVKKDAAYKSYVIKDLRKTYGYMLSKGATSFWETIKGEADFHNAGSLCHGWSALPVYYFRMFRDIL